ncbi:uncharacterized protein N7479_006665 [Penicillium vulpinum]|uniref:uncharacterized protein n=1 Tax=Penicillium vulpinum TaxID=29845 RepID=UPI002548DF09|nr:uncharacterized protein N7479_006665 [Penicillium vulpinum]KAJ5959515.1 hypothetical protein N7479_006665 [Penicillium vulpinum]
MADYVLPCLPQARDSSKWWTWELTEGMEPVPVYDDTMTVYLSNKMAAEVRITCLLDAGLGHGPDG